MDNSRTMRTSDGLQLQVYDWPLNGPSHGVVVLSHGLGEHLGRYQHVAAFLNGLGWRVTGYDHRGHGRSEGRRGALDGGEDDLVSDLGQFIRRVRHSNAGLPLVLMGHSMGALTAARFVAEGLMQRPASWYQPVDGLVLSSPPIDMGLGAVQKTLLAVLPSWLLRTCVGSGLKPEWVCNAPDVVAAYGRDPLVHDRISGRLARSMEYGGRTVVSVAPRWQAPTLLMWSGADRCLDAEATAEFAAALPQDLAESHVFPDLAHEILNEVERERVFEKLQAWLERLGTLPQQRGVRAPSTPVGPRMPQRKSRFEVSLFASQSFAAKTVSLIVGPLGFGVLAGLALGWSVPLWWAIVVVGSAGALAAGYEHVSAMPGMLRGAWGAVLFACALLATLAMTGSPALVPLPKPAWVLVPMYMLSGTVLGAIGGWWRSRRLPAAAPRG